MTTPTEETAGGGNRNATANDLPPARAARVLRTLRLLVAFLMAVARLRASKRSTP